MGSDRAIKSFKRNFTKILEREPFPNTQLGNDIGDENLLRQCMRAEPRRQLHSRSKKIVMMLDWFSGGGANPDFN
jgi:hypothetical protein